MKHTKVFLLVMVSLVYLFAAAAPGEAGSRQRHRWEGVAIGIGAAVLGHALFQHHKDPHPEKVVVYDGIRDNRRRHHKHRKHRRGHWEMEKVWRPPVYERTWNPGHYNRKGHWVDGHWIKIKVKKGRWVNQRVWISGYCP